MLFSSSSKDSTYPSSRSRATMELSPHPNDIRVRSLHMGVSWYLTIPIVKYVILTEVVIQDVNNLVFPKVTPQTDSSSSLAFYCHSKDKIVSLHTTP
jgi:hypothetical protein